jgi:sorbitol/mannitol transport system substrate-binding protein
MGRVCAPAEHLLARRPGEVNAAKLATGLDVSAETIRRFRNNGGFALPGKLVLAAVGLLLATAGCSGAGTTGGRDAADNTITALMVGNPQMADIQKLTAENFTRQTGITVKFTVLPENELRERVTEDVANQGGQYDVATVGAYEVPIWAKSGWLRELSTRAQADAAYDVDDLIKPMVASLTGDDG